MEDYIKTLEEQNKLLKEINEINNRLIEAYKDRIEVQQMIIDLRHKHDTNN